MKIRVCPKCGSHSHEDAWYCERLGCGQVLSIDTIFELDSAGNLRRRVPREVIDVEATWDCPRCGTKNPRGSLDCLECGYELKPEEIDDRLQTGETVPLPAAPWLSIWVFPKKTIRFIVDADPRMWVVPLAVISGAANLLQAAIGGDWGNTLALHTILVTVAVAGPILGLVGFYVGGGLLRWSGSILGGKASSEEVRAAIAWSSIPSIAYGLLSTPLIVMLGSEAFTTEMPRFEALALNSPALWLLAAFIVIGLGLASIVLVIWRFVVFLRCLAEVHGFSSWKALAATLIPMAILFVPLCCLAVAAGTSLG